MRIVVTGTPGTGKSTLARKLAKLLGAELIEANKEVDEIKAYKLVKGEKEVRLKKLQAHLARKLKISNPKRKPENHSAKTQNRKPTLQDPKPKTQNSVLEGHVLCEFSLPVDVIIVLRCDPRVLEKRLERRGYSERKAKENVLSEALDYCLVKAEYYYGKGKIIQLDNTKFLSVAKALESVKKKSVKVRWLAKPSKRLLDYFLRMKTRTKQKPL